MRSFVCAIPWPLGPAGREVIRRGADGAGRAADRHRPEKIRHRYDPFGRGDDLIQSLVVGETEADAPLFCRAISSISHKLPIKIGSTRADDQ